MCQVRKSNEMNESPCWILGVWFKEAEPSKVFLTSAVELITKEADSNLRRLKLYCDVTDCLPQKPNPPAEL